MTLVIGGNGLNTDKTAGMTDSAKVNLYDLVCSGNDRVLPDTRSQGG